MDVLNGLGINPQSQSYRANFLEIPAGSLSGKTFVLTGTLSHPMCIRDRVFGGHYFTETFGVKALGLLLKDVYGLDYTFIDLPPSSRCV